MMIMNQTPTLISYIKLCNLPSLHQTNHHHPNLHIPIKITIYTQTKRSPNCGKYQKPKEREITRSNIFTNLSSVLELSHYHVEDKNPPIDMKHK